MQIKIARLLQPNKQNTSFWSVSHWLYWQEIQTNKFIKWDQMSMKSTQESLLLNQIKWRILPSTWLSCSLSKLTNTLFTTGNVEQLQPSPFLTFSMSSKGATGKVSVDGKCGFRGEAFSDNSRLTLKSHINSIVSSSLSSGWNYVKEEIKRNLLQANMQHVLNPSRSWHAWATCLT